MKVATMIGQAPIVVLALLAALLVAPELFRVPLTHDSFALDLWWSQQFTEGLRSGEIYPRWLPRSFDGLGAPVFYFYPPLAFYISGCFGLLGFSPRISVVLSGFALLFLSGVTMRMWTRSTAVSALYMLGPYHLFDFYFRGDLAEFSSFVFLPLVALGIRDGRLALLAVSYALLICAHLPVALLASLFFIGPYLLWGRSSADILRRGLALSLGLGIASVYLYPALTLQRYIDVELLTTPFYTPGNWVIWRLFSSPDPLLLTAMTCFAAAAAVIALSLRPTFWTMCTIFACLCAVGLPVWQLPLLNRVQFPYRILVVVEFAVITALSIQSLNVRLFLVPLPAIAVILLSFVFPEPVGVEAAEATEYLPPGLVAATEHPRPMQAPDYVRRAPARQTRGDVTVVRTFWFPSWRCGARPTFPDSQTRLLSFKTSACEPSLVQTPEERIGLLLSLTALVFLALVLVVDRIVKSRPAGEN